LTQSNALSLVAESLDLRQHVQTCLRELQPLAEANQVELCVDAPPGVSFTCEADPDRIDQVLLNLLENACLYATPGTTIDLKLRRSRQRILCTVTNHVEVIPHNADAWGTAFWRGKESRARHPRGKGLGLTVINQLVTAHGGYTLNRVTDSSVTIGFVLPTATGCAPDCS
jgi:signal transduction histidine kinase